MVINGSEIQVGDVIRSERMLWHREVTRITHRHCGMLGDNWVTCYFGNGTWQSLSSTETVSIRR